MEDLYFIPQVYLERYESNKKFFETYDVTTDFFDDSCSSILEAV